MYAVLASFLLALPASATQEERVTYAQVTMRERVIVRRHVMVRVPRMEPPRQPAAKPIRYKEKKGPACIPVAELRGAIVTARDRIDLVLRGGRRVRAEFDDDCRNLDFYRGFYLKPAADGMVCAGRDMVRARSGAKCLVKRYRKLVPRD